jgi:fructokinase
VSAAQPATPWALGVDLGGTKIHAELLAADGRTHWQERVATPAGDYEGTLRGIAGLVARARQAVGGAAPTIGLGGPGALAADGRIKNANSTCLNGRPLVQDLQRLLGQPVRFANDANCLALSEAVDGAGAGRSVVFAAILGTGTGAGITVDGRVLTGPNRLAGEWGHNPLPWPDAADTAVERCWCGLPGCVESYLSGPGITRDHVRHGGQAMPAADIAAAAAAGDAACAATLERHASRLARSLAGVINLLDPDIIVLGGGLSRMPQLYERVPQLWDRWIFSGGVRDPVRTELKPALHGDASGVRGAAWLWRD